MLSCVMKGECAESAMEQYNAMKCDGQVLVVLQYARVVEISEGLFVLF